MYGFMKGKAGLITGATSGIGKACAILFAEEGASVMVAGRNAERGAAVVEEIRAAGGTAEFFQCDVTDEANVEALVKATVEAFGKLDFAVNDAGMCLPLANLPEISSEGFDTLMRTNLYGPFYCMKHEVPAMLANGGGSIVNVTSGMGLVSGPGQAPYSASKAAVNSLTKSVATEYSHDNIRVNAVCPGMTDTPILAWLPDEAKAAIQAGLPTGRMSEPIEQAYMVLFLCTDFSQSCLGMTFVVDGGYVASR